jgi:nicotinamide-nucleotide amidase
VAIEATEPHGILIEEESMVRKPIRVGLVLTGSEIVKGRVQDRNGSWLAERFTDLGCEMVRFATERDRGINLRRALVRLRDERPPLDLIVITGGTGSTLDDRTLRAVSWFTGRRLIFDRELSRLLALQAPTESGQARQDWLAAARKQAWVPDGAAMVMPVEGGTAPAWVVPAGHRTPAIAGFPGPPEEVQALFGPVVETAPMQELLSHAVAAPRRRIIRLAGMDETLLGQTERRAKRVLPLGGLDINTCFEAGGAELILDTTFPPGREEAYSAFEDYILERLGEHVFSLEGQSVDEIFSILCRGRTVGIFDTATRGLVNSRVSSCAVTHHMNLDARDRGGATMSAVLARLGVPRAGDTPDAEELALGARSAFVHTDIGVGIAPVSGDRRKIEVAVVGPGGTQIRETLHSPAEKEMSDGRTATEAMHLLRRLLEQATFSR